MTNSLLHNFSQDLDAFDDYSEEKKEHYFSAEPSGWDDPENGQVLHSYMQTGNDYQGANVHRGDSFMSPAVFVWYEEYEKPLKTLMCVNVCMCESVIEHMSV